MIDNSTVQKLFQTAGIDKQLKLTFENGDVLTNKDILYESQEITESLCSESELKYGSCEAASYKITIVNKKKSYKGQTFTVDVVLNGKTTFRYGTYRVNSDRPTANRIHREIVAYDMMYDIIHYDAILTARWYNEFFENHQDSTPTVKEFRDSFFELVGVEQETASLIIDDVDIRQSSTPKTLSPQVIITSICEFGGVFGHIGRDNVFHYIDLKEGKASSTTRFPSLVLYPSKSIYPTKITYDDGKTLISRYTFCDYEDFVTKTVTKVSLIGDDTIFTGTDESATVDESEANEYMISDNILLTDTPIGEYFNIPGRIYEKIKDVKYQPFTLTTMGNPCVEVGDHVRIITTDGTTIDSYILSRTITGIQALTDNFSSEGVEFFTPDTNYVSQELETSQASIKKVEESVENVQNDLEAKFEAFQQALADAKTMATNIEKYVGGIKNPKSLEFNYMQNSNDKLEIAHDEYDGQKKFTFPEPIVLVSAAEKMIANAIANFFDHFTIKKSGGTTGIYNENDVCIVGDTESGNTVINRGNNGKRAYIFGEAVCLGSASEPVTKFVMNDRQIGAVITADNSTVAESVRWTTKNVKSSETFLSTNASFALSPGTYQIEGEVVFDAPSTDITGKKAVRFWNYTNSTEIECSTSEIASVGQYSYTVHTSAIVEVLGANKTIRLEVRQSNSTNTTLTISRAIIKATRIVAGTYNS